MPPRDPLSAFLGFDVEGDGQVEASPLEVAPRPAAREPHPSGRSEFEFSELSVLAAAEARAASQLDIIVAKAGVAGTIAVLDRLRVRMLENARRQGQVGSDGGWIF